MIVLGIDPGSSEFAWARLRTGERGAEYIDCGKSACTRVDVAKVLATEHDRLAIEQHGLVFRVEGASYMCQSSEWAGVAYGMTRLPEEHIQRITAVDWRTELGLGRNPSDAAVKAVILGNVRGLPSRTNSHTRDAMGVALAALWRIRTKRVA